LRTYTVQRGDTLNKIAKKFKVSVYAIAQLNGIKDPDKIRLGATLRLPELTTDSMDGDSPVDTGDNEPTTPSALPIDQTSFVLPRKEFYPEATKKDLIVLHFTAGGTARGAFYTWLNNPEHVGTAYIVDTDGVIYELFDPSYWAYHLGIKGMSIHDRRSIGIEIVNVGPLKPSPLDSNVLNWWPNNWGTRWCVKEQMDRYVESSFRGVGCFAAFPEPQMKSVGALVKHLCDRFNIKKCIPPRAQRSEYDLSYFRSYLGIAAHQNYRADKWDVGPAFNWDELGV
jgi:N-acetyl-anhydromuramyl-L-alanine amidase AmpD